MNTIHILCNGNEHPIPKDMLLGALLDKLQLEAGSVVAEINNTIIQPDQYTRLKLKDGDQVELIRFVGGG